MRSAAVLPAFLPAFGGGSTMIFPEASARATNALRSASPASSAAAKPLISGGEKILKPRTLPSASGASASSSASSPAS